MRQKIEERIGALSNEIQDLNQEREGMYKRNREIEVRIHQLVGAIYELQLLISQDYQQSETSVQQQGATALSPEELALLEQMAEEDQRHQD